MPTVESSHLQAAVAAVFSSFRSEVEAAMWMIVDVSMA